MTVTGSRSSWKKSLVSFRPFRQRQFLEDAARVSIGLVDVCLGRFDKGEKSYTIYSTLGCSRKQPVFASHDERSNRVFSQVVIGAQATVFNVDYQFLPVVHR